MASPSSTPHPVEPIPLATPQQIEFTDSDVEMIEEATTEETTTEEATTEEVENEAETDDEMPELINDSDVENEPSEDTPHSRR